MLRIEELGEFKVALEEKLSPEAMKQWRAATVAALHSFMASGESFFSSATIDSLKLFDAHHRISTVLSPGHWMSGSSALAGISGNNISKRIAFIEINQYEVHC